MTDPMEMLKALEIIFKIENQIGLSYAMDKIKDALEKRLAEKLAVDIEEPKDE